MNLFLNGAQAEAPEGATVEQLLISMGLTGRGLAVERNLEIVARSLYPVTRLHEGDRIEIVQFVGGG
jgi:thiamine biosynthesis protein ThiS